MNEIFVQQRQPIANNSILSTDQVFYTLNRLINRLNPHKSHGHDGMSIRMLKLCNLTITKPIYVCKNWLQQGVFPDDWNKSTIIPEHKTTLNK